VPGLVGNLAHQTFPRQANLTGGFDICLAARLLFQLIERDALAQEVVRGRQAGELQARVRLDSAQDFDFAMLDIVTGRRLLKYVRCRY
jgi:hypothetical protein